MKDATLAQGNGVLTLILQKQTCAEQLQDLLTSGVLADVLDANVAVVNRIELRKVLGLKQVVLVYFDPDGWAGGSAGCYRACLRDDRTAHAAGKTPDIAIEDLMRTLKSFNLPYSRDQYAIEDQTRFKSPHPLSNSATRIKPYVG
jgi:hypothetical protein